jgi:hypothetical protein
MAKYRSRLVVEAEPSLSGYRVTYPNGSTEEVSAHEFGLKFQPLSTVLDWQGEHWPGPGRLYDANGKEIDKAVCFADLESGLVLYVEKDEHGKYSPTKRREVYPAPLKFVPGR